MNRGLIKFSVGAIASVLLLAGSGIVTEAAALPSGGVDLTLAKGVGLETIAAPNKTNLQIEKMLEEILVQETPAARSLDEQESEEEMYKNLVIARVNSRVNVRSLPSEQGTILGRLYNNSVGTFLGEEDGWYQISSGSVTGYVKAEFCVTGEDAVALVDEAGTRIAKVNTTTLKVRTEPSLEASVLGLVPLADELVVCDETEDWVKVDIEEGFGWVSRDYVDLHTEFVTAESKAEEDARLKKEAEARRKAQEAARASQAAHTSKPSAPVNYQIGEGSDMGKAVVEYALQFVGNPYVYGGTSLTNGADCSGFVMSVYANFGVSLPHSSSADRTQGYAVEGGLANAQPGDLVCYSGHVALYVGNGQIVHASNKKTGIIVSNADYKRTLAVRRIF